ncbi:MAG: 2-C-methyl-D-erythritol 2,4-cyclodiphosphate synthase [Chloroflexi bacterium]|nr:MAG: 2-C-methyl-D-erythritol 2,4-cyclodiphosphate synthase [Chloroflexota bacterium]
MRVGIGYDVHPLVDGRRLVLGGVVIEHRAGLDGHSDADVLTHAVIDALLGAAGLGDIGRHFPASDPKFKDASSLEMLAAAVESLRAAGFRVVNVDCTVIAQAPRLQPHLAAMTAELARRLGTDNVNVKGKSPEGIGALGQEAGIAAQAVAMLEEEMQNREAPSGRAASRPGHLPRPAGKGSPPPRQAGKGSRPSRRAGR